MKVEKLTAGLIYSELDDFQGFAENVRNEFKSHRPDHFSVRIEKESLFLVHRRRSS
jgi:hypothetical protein